MKTHVDGEYSTHIFASQPLTNWYRDHNWDQSLQNLGFAEGDIPLLDFDFPLPSQQEMSYTDNDGMG